MVLPDDVVPYALVIAGLVLVVVALVVVTVLAVRRARRLGAERTVNARARVDLELSVADQSGRLRMIRELHDLSLHRVTTMISDADGARYAGQTDPNAAVRAAGTISETGRTALADMRRVSLLVRESEAEIGLQPTLKSTRDLFAIMRDAGLTVIFERSGDPYQVTPGAELMIYRIMQEALSNSLKYGGEGTTARVAFTWTQDGFQARVDDDGFRNAAIRKGMDPTAPMSYTVEDDLHALTDEIVGPGIAVMRERAELYGGTLNVTQTPGVGFSISAVFPTLRHHNGVHGVDLSRGAAR
ncbi:sensor histidine kinase [Naasia lichenicola]|uniref:histidine kinase n=1 Tax=Naasia lichenicola TaxID=2565933 RepID=A0A4S4FGF3_9MICO|nr:ATP-binding protein [Naasia lichenicola]THG28146.1 ATP-binding protein [Naasia lichenicola]